MEAIIQDVGFALRMFRKHPAFTAVALITLAVGALVVATSLLVLSATLGFWIPARRALRVEPVVALKYE